MKPAVCLAALIAFASVHAEPTEIEDPIDVAMDKAMDKDPSTAGMVQAAADADTKWQKEIDRALSRLKEAMSAKQWKALQRSQAAWKSYRDKEVATQDTIYESMQGSMWVPVAATSITKLDKARALLLRDYIEKLAEQ